MWLPNDIVRKIDQIARFRYINKRECEVWNAHRRVGELRLLTGWEWIAKDGSAHCQGLKTITVAYRNAYYALVRKEDAPSLALGRRISPKVEKTQTPETRNLNA